MPLSEAPGENLSPRFLWMQTLLGLWLHHYNLWFTAPSVLSVPNCVLPHSVRLYIWLHLGPTQIIQDNLSIFKCLIIFAKILFPCNIHRLQELGNKYPFRRENIFSRPQLSRHQADFISIFQTQKHSFWQKLKMGNCSEMFAVAFSSNMLTNQQAERMPVYRGRHENGSET